MLGGASLVALLGLSWAVGPPNPACKAPESAFLWRVYREPGDPPVHLFGTIHVPYTRVWAGVAPEAVRAFKAAEKIIFELDLSDAETLSSLYSCKLLPGRTRLRDVLPRPLFGRIQALVRRFRGLEENASTRKTRRSSVIGDWERLRPIWLLLMLNSLGRDDSAAAAAPSLDEFLAQKAHYADKQTLRQAAFKVGAIEDVSEQCAPLNSLQSSEVEFALSHTLDLLEAAKDLRRRDRATADLVQHYNCGTLTADVFGRDTMQLSQLASGGAAAAARGRAIDAYFHRELITKRNRRMAERVARTIDHFPRDALFFAFGAGHFFGADNVVELLRAQGFRVEAVAREEAPLIASPYKFLSRDSSGGGWERRELRTVGRAPRQPQFRELWVRLKDFTPRPWQEIEDPQAFGRPMDSGTTARSPLLLLLLPLLALLS